MKPSTVLIHTPCNELEDDHLEPPLGLLYLATLLIQHGYPAKIVDLSSVPPEAWTDLIPAADLYGFSSYTTTYHRTLQILALVKRRFPHARTVAGGPHATALPELVAHDFDFVVTGEGEQALLDLVQTLEKGNVPARKLTGIPMTNLDDLPFPDFSLVNLNSYHRVVAGMPSVSILSSRGCPYPCVFCSSIVMRARQQMRFRSAENVAGEIRQIKARWGVDSFRFQDDLFTVSLPRLRALAGLLEREHIIYRCFGRVDLCSRETAELLYRSGCRHIAFGVESGSDLILQRMKKGQTSDDIRRGIANARAAGLTVRVYLIVGFPGETWTTIQETADLMRECRPDEFSVYPLIPYPGTDMYLHPQEFGITSINPDFSQYFQVQSGRRTGYVFRTGELNEGIIAEMRAFIIRQMEEFATWAGCSKSFR